MNKSKNGRGDTGGSSNLDDNTEWQSSTGPVLALLLARLFATPLMGLKGDKVGSLLRSFPFQQNPRSLPTCKVSRSQASQVWGKRPVEVPHFQLVGCVPWGWVGSPWDLLPSCPLTLTYPNSGSLGVGTEGEQNLPP